jgi:hypothetical protein
MGTAMCALPKPPRYFIAGPNRFLIGLESAPGGGAGCGTPLAAMPCGMTCAGRIPGRLDTGQKMAARVRHRLRRGRCRLCHWHRPASRSGEALDVV